MEEVFQDSPRERIGSVRLHWRFFFIRAIRAIRGWNTTIPWEPKQKESFPMGLQLPAARPIRHRENSHACCIADGVRFSALSSIPPILQDETRPQTHERQRLRKVHRSQRVLADK